MNIGYQKPFDQNQFMVEQQKIFDLEVWQTIETASSMVDPNGIRLYYFGNDREMILSIQKVGKLISRIDFKSLVDPLILGRKNTKELRIHFHYLWRLAHGMESF